MREGRRKRGEKGKKGKKKRITENIGKEKGK